MMLNEDFISYKKIESCSQPMGSLSALHYIEGGSIHRSQAPRVMVHSRLNCPSTFVVQGLLRSIDEIELDWKSIHNSDLMIKRIMHNKLEKTLLL